MSCGNTARRAIRSRTRFFRRERKSSLIPPVAFSVRCANWTAWNIAPSFNENIKFDFISEGGIIKSHDSTSPSHSLLSPERRYPSARRWIAKSRTARARGSWIQSLIIRLYDWFPTWFPRTNCWIGNHDANPFVDLTFRSILIWLPN